MSYAVNRASPPESVMSKHSINCEVASKIDFSISGGIMEDSLRPLSGKMRRATQSLGMRTQVGS